MATLADAFLADFDNDDEEEDELKDMQGGFGEDDDDLLALEVRGLARGAALTAPARCGARCPPALRWRCATLTR
jgi:hypothetical protein